eukprot:TRINITY_DN997_c0_g1_i4.p2 TRINITY_DN997_c0_g1~~TRINITY_DN997_c0_g1_i4.p2  ORF type:complete len:331 (-),score=85.70 TRINITY_DN997_c0_g1_i4:46-1038(-)
MTSPVMKQRQGVDFDTKLKREEDVLVSLQEGVHKAKETPSHYIDCGRVRTDQRDVFALEKMILAATGVKCRMWLRSDGNLFLKCPGDVHETACAVFVAEFLAAANAAGLVLRDSRSTSIDGYGQGDWGMRPRGWDIMIPQPLQAECVVKTDLQLALEKGFNWFFLHAHSDAFVLIVADQLPGAVRGYTPGQLSITVYDRAAYNAAVAAQCQALSFPMGNYVASAPGSAAPVAITVNQTIHFGRVDHTGTAPGATNVHYPVGCTQAGTHWLVLPATSFYSALAAVPGWSVNAVPTPPAGAALTVAIDLFNVKQELYADAFNVPGVGPAVMP